MTELIATAEQVEHRREIETFFEKWLPAAFERLAEKDTRKGIADCSLVAEIGSDVFTLSVRSGQLSVERVNRLPSTFRLRASLEAFVRLLPSPDQLSQAEGRLGHLLRLDAETVRLVAAVPGALKVSVKDDAKTWDVVLGPGNASLDAPRCSVTCQFSDFQELRTQQKNPMDLFLSGKLALDGDLEVALALGGLFMN